jgi:hypothetical protein
MILLQGFPPPPPPPPNGWMGQSPFESPCGGMECIPIDQYWVVLLFVALLFGIIKLVHYDNNNK